MLNNSLNISRKRIGGLCTLTLNAQLAYTGQTKNRYISRQFLTLVLLDTLTTLISLIQNWRNAIPIIIGVFNVEISIYSRAEFFIYFIQILAFYLFCKKYSNTFEKNLRTNKRKIPRVIFHLFYANNCILFVLQKIFEHL